MSTFQTRIQEYVGTVSDTTAMTDWLTAGAGYLIDRLPLEKFEKYTSDVTDAGVGVSVKGKKVFRAHKSGYEAMRIPAGLKAQAVDSDSIHYRTSTNPAFYIENGVLYIVPSGGTAIALAYPTVAYGDSTISVFPPELEQGVVLYASIQAAIQKYNLSIATLLALSLAASEVIPTAPAAATFTYTDAVLGTYTSTTIGSDEVVPTYTKPTFGGSFTQANTYIVTSEDIDLASVELNRQSVVLNQHQADIQNELNEFNKEALTYNSTIQKQIEQARLTQQRILENANKSTDLSIINEAKTLEAQISEYSANLQRYSEQFQSYVAETNRAVSKYQTDTAKTAQVMQANLVLVQTLRTEFKEYLN